MSVFIRLLFISLLIITPTSSILSKKKKHRDEQKSINDAMSKMEANINYRYKLALIQPQSVCYLPDFDYDGIPDRFDQCPSTSGIDSRSGCPEIDPTKLVTFAKHTISMSDHDFDTAIIAFHQLDFDRKGKISQNSLKNLDEFIEVLKRRKNLIVSLSSYVDMGEQSNNDVMSKTRLKELRSYMVKKGIASKRIKGFSFGDSMPVVDLPLTRFEVEIDY